MRIIGVKLDCSNKSKNSLEAFQRSIPFGGSYILGHVNCETVFSPAVKRDPHPPKKKSTKSEPEIMVK